MTEHIVLFAWAMGPNGWPVLLPHSELATRETYRKAIARIKIHDFDAPAKVRRYLEAA